MCGVTESGVRAPWRRLETICEVCLRVGTVIVYVVCVCLLLYNRNSSNGNNDVQRKYYNLKPAVFFPLLFSRCRNIHFVASKSRSWPWDHYRYSKVWHEEIHRIYSVFSYFFIEHIQIVPYLNHVNRATIQIHQNGKCLRPSFEVKKKSGPFTPGNKKILLFYILRRIP
jgi:hypothetical protein